jgi:hypothetical protein
MQLVSWLNDHPVLALTIVPRSDFMLKSSVCQLTRGCVITVIQMAQREKRDRKPSDKQKEAIASQKSRETFTCPLCPHVCLDGIALSKHKRTAHRNGQRITQDLRQLSEEELSAYKRRKSQESSAAHRQKKVRSHVLPPIETSKYLYLSMLWRMRNTLHARLVSLVDSRLSVLYSLCISDASLDRRS